jgi:hypothetical protein
MKHIQHITMTDSLPAQASLIELQQKATVLTAFATALASWGNSLGIWQGLRDE